MNEIAVVTEQDIPDILRMIHEIYSELPNKEWFSLDSDEEVTSYMMTGGFGLKAMCDGRLAGVFIARAKNYDFVPQEEEIAQIRWVDIGYASTILTYENDKNIVNKAKAAIKEF